MAIQAKRFQFLDEETNVAIADLYREGNDSILNSPLNDYQPIDLNREAFLKALGMSDPSEMELPVDLVPESLRESLDGMSDLEDLEGLTPKELMALSGEYFPNNPLGQSKFSQLSSRCQQRALGRNGQMGRRYGQSNNCNGVRRPANSGCSSESFGRSIEQASGGDFNFDFLDLDGAMRSLMGLSSMGYDMNMCGVFGSLGRGMPTDMLSRASGGLLGHLTASKNVLGMLDLASSSGNLKTKLFNPSAITSMTKSFQFPSEIRSRDVSSLADRFMGAMEVFDEDWSRSTYDQRLTTRGISNRQMGSLLQQRSLNNVFDDQHLDVIPDHDIDFLSAGFSL